MELWTLDRSIVGSSPKCDTVIRTCVFFSFWNIQFRKLLVAKPLVLLLKFQYVLLQGLLSYTTLVGDTTLIITIFITL